MSGLKCDCENCRSIQKLIDDPDARPTKSIADQLAEAADAMLGPTRGLKTSTLMMLVGNYSAMVASGKIHPIYERRLLEMIEEVDHRSPIPQGEN